MKKLLKTMMVLVGASAGLAAAQGVIALIQRNIGRFGGAQEWWMAPAFVALCIVIGGVIMLLLSERLAAAIRRYVQPGDFTDPCCHQVAEQLYEQQQQGAYNPAAIISRFEDPEEQRQVAAMFNATLKQVDTPAETEKALQETIRRVKQESLALATEQLDSMDMVGLQKLVAKKRELERLHISLD